MRRAARAPVAAVALAVLAAAMAPADAQPRRGRKARAAAKPTRPAWLQGAPPAGWSEQASLARSVATGLRQSRPFGDVATRAGAVAHARRGAGALYLSWVEADQAAPDPPVAVRRALDHLRDSRLVSSPEARSTEELLYVETVDGGVAGAQLEWRHLSNETVSLVRAFAWVSGDGKPRLGAAECVISTGNGEAPPAVEKACRDALATLAVSVPPAQRGALASLPPSQAGADDSRLALGHESGAGAAAQPGASTAGNPPTIGRVAPDAEGRVLYRGPEPTEEGGSATRWIILFGVGLVIVAIFMTVRSRRAEAAGSGEEPDARADTGPIEPEPEASLESQESDPAPDPEAGQENNR